jgi:hypothetical protein
MTRRCLKRRYYSGMGLRKAWERTLLNDAINEKAERVKVAGLQLNV